MYDDSEHIGKCIKRAIGWIVTLGVIIIELFLIFMPEQYHYQYEGEVVRVEHDTRSFRNCRYTYIDKISKDTMAIEQNDQFYSGYYTQRSAEKKVYTYRWWASSLVWLLPAFICFMIIHFFIIDD